VHPPTNTAPQIIVTNVKHNPLLNLAITHHTSDRQLSISLTSIVIYNKCNVNSLQNKLYNKTDNFINGTTYNFKYAFKTLKKPHLRQALYACLNRDFIYYVYILAVG
jgi:ABC-type transport system substrate-binding protein